MDKYLIVGLVFVVCIVIIIYTQMDSRPKSEKVSLKEMLQKEFSEYKIIERNQNIIICCDSPNQRVAEELVLIRIDPQQQKNLRTSGKMLIATYSKQPSIREMKKDFSAYL
ncbi:hypothetical protein [Acinetobacter sp. ANC 4648]|uniref:hypothetical protein n=1 Tax=Acinetobacter sp. ANC 4648 TaxID=1977875 RepID=UPI000A35AB10|nr:hypothetical protein [Acinetobacter sp. ANC 4648]OTG82279.1 hypothetical protein B9T27_08510 [Acinetobacter sp. ANC 4648]